MATIPLVLGEFLSICQDEENGAKECSKTNGDDNIWISGSFAKADAMFQYPRSVFGLHTDGSPYRIRGILGLAGNETPQHSKTSMNPENPGSPQALPQGFSNSASHLAPPSPKATSDSVDNASKYSEMILHDSCVGAIEFEGRIEIEWLRLVSAPPTTTSKRERIKNKMARLLLAGSPNEIRLESYGVRRTPSRNVVGATALYNSVKRVKRHKPRVAIRMSNVIRVCRVDGSSSDETAKTIDGNFMVPGLFAFAVHTPLKVYYFCVPCQQQRDFWVTRILEQMNISLQNG